MSYSIFYRKQFIKVSDNEVIPFFESGSNNCYDVGLGNRQYGRRSRSWGNHRMSGGKIILTHDEIFADIEEYQQSLIQSGVNNKNEYGEDFWLYNPNSFDWYSGLSINSKGTSKTTFNDYLNFYKCGIKKAATIEELYENGIHIYLTVSQYSENVIKYNGLEMKDEVLLTTTKQMIDAINEYSQYYSNIDCLWLESVSERNITQYLKSKAKKMKRKEKEFVTLNGYYAIKCPNNGLLVKLTKYGYRYSYDVSENNKLFKTEKQANSYLKKADRGAGYSVLYCSGSITVRM